MSVRNWLSVSRICTFALTVQKPNTRFFKSWFLPKSRRDCAHTWIPKRRKSEKRRCSTSSSRSTDTSLEKGLHKFRQARSISLRNGLFSTVTANMSSARETITTDGCPQSKLHSGRRILNSRGTPIQLHFPLLVTTALRNNDLMEEGSAVLSKQNQSSFKRQNCETDNDVSQLLSSAKAPFLSEMPFLVNVRDEQRQKTWQQQRTNRNPADKLISIGTCTSPPPPIGSTLHLTPRHHLLKRWSRLERTTLTHIYKMDWQIIRSARRRESTVQRPKKSSQSEPINKVLACVQWQVKNGALMNKALTSRTNLWAHVVKPLNIATVHANNGVVAIGTR